MGQLGKYTTYVGGSATDAHKLLSKLYPASPFAVPLTAGDEAAAQAIVQTIAVAKVVKGVGGIQPSDGVQAGDLGMFPNGVKLGFGDSPDVTQVKWVNPGDPASPYIPDVTSPGPGKTQGRDKVVDPTSTVPGIIAESTTDDVVGQNLRDPSNDGPAIYKNNTLGNPQKLGDSGGNI